jgi:hypothetical protein
MIKGIEALVPAALRMGLAVVELGPSWKMCAITKGVTRALEAGAAKYVAPFHL